MIKCGRPPKGNEQQSRDRVLDTALKLFLEQGYGGLSMEALARDARVSLRTLYNQFGAKSGLFGALIRRCGDQFMGGLMEDGDLETVLTNFGRQFLFRITRPDVIRIRAILLAESPRFPDLATLFYEQGPKRTLNHLAEFFRREQQAGHIVEADALFLAEQFVCALRGERLQRLQLGLEMTPDEADVEQWARKATQYFLKGCLVTFERKDAV